MPQFRSGAAVQDTHDNDIDDDRMRMVATGNQDLAIPQKQSQRRSLRTSDPVRRFANPRSCWLISS